jgi:hypothetical protein
MSRNTEIIPDPVRAAIEKHSHELSDTHRVTIQHFYQYRAEIVGSRTAERGLSGTITF